MRLIEWLTSKHAVDEYTEEYGWVSVLIVLAALAAAILAAKIVSGR